MSFVLIYYIISAEILKLFFSSEEDCVQQWITIPTILVITSLKTSCDNKPKCRPIPSSSLVLKDCGNLPASYLHVEYICALTNPTTAINEITSTTTTTT